MLPLPPSSTLFPYTTLFRSLFLSKDYTATQHCTECAQQGCQLWTIWSHSLRGLRVDRKSTRLNSSHVRISYAVFCLKKKKKKTKTTILNHKKNTKKSL